MDGSQASPTFTISLSLLKLVSKSVALFGGAGLGVVTEDISS